MTRVGDERLPRDLVTILRTEAKNQRTPPIDYAIAEDGGRMVHRPDPDIAMAELLEEAASALAAKDAELAAMKVKCQALDDECQQSMLDIARERDRAERAEAQLAERAGGVNEDALRALAQAYDREDAAQRGEPDPWNLDDPGDIGDSDTWVSERLGCARAAAEAFLSALSTGAHQ